MHAIRVKILVRIMFGSNSDWKNVVIKLPPKFNCLVQDNTKVFGKIISSCKYNHCECVGQCYFLINVLTRNLDTKILF